MCRPASVRRLEHGEAGSVGGRAPGSTVVGGRPYRLRGVTAVPLAGQPPYQHVAGLVQIEPRSDQHPTYWTPAPDRETRTATVAAATPAVDLVVTQQDIQRRAGPGLDRAEPWTTIALGSHRGRRGVAQHLS